MVAACSSQWGQTRLFKEGKLIMKAKSGVTEWIHRVGSAHQRHAGAKHAPGIFFFGSEEAARHGIFDLAFQRRGIG